MDFFKLNALLDECFASAWKSRLFLFFSGAIYPLGFSPLGWWPLTFVSLLPLLISLTRPGVLTPFKRGYYWGCGAFLIGASWVYVSIHEFGYVPVVGAAFMTLAFVAYLAIYKGIFAYLCVKLMWLSDKHWLIFIAPMCWLLSEFLQAAVFGGFPWLIAGYSQTDAGLGPVASWLGVYGVSWLIIAISVCLTGLFDATQQVGKPRKAAFTALLILLGVAIVANIDERRTDKIRFADHTVKVALVQPNVPQEQKWDRRYFSQIVDILYQETTPHWGVDFLIWPEGAIPAYAHQVTDILHDLKKEGQQNHTQLLVGIPELERQTDRSYVALKALGSQSQTYYKQVLVPFGEYVPLENWLRGVIKFLDLPMSGFTPGDSQQTAMQFNQASIIPAICYEIVYPEIIRGLSASADPALPQLIVTVSNDAWFGDSLGPYQHMQMARMRSLELGMPLIRSTNDGITAVIDRHGRFLEKLPRYQQASLAFTLSLENRITLYRRFGYIGILSLCGLSALFILWSIAIKRGKK